jgi:hypothetical protein
VIIINADANATHQSVIHVMEPRGRRASSTSRSRPKPQASDVTAAGQRVHARERVVAAWYEPRPTLRAWLAWPLSVLFGCLRASARDVRAGLARVERMPVPVVVVGNITAGGSGKTPLVIALSDALRSRGFHPGVVSSGHGGTAESKPSRRTRDPRSRRRAADRRGRGIPDVGRPQALRCGARAPGRGIRSATW